MKKQLAKQVSFKELISGNFINDLAESHLEVWKDRYYRAGKDTVRADLKMNHDDSLEIERAKEEIGRELTDKEQETLINKFHSAVVKKLY